MNLSLTFMMVETRILRLFISDYSDQYSHFILTEDSEFSLMTIYLLKQALSSSPLVLSTIVTTFVSAGR